MRKYGKKTIALLLGIAILGSTLFTAGCGAEEGENHAAEAAQNDKIQIGFSMDSFIIERWQRDRDLFVSKAQELGAEVNIQNANGDVKEQISQIEYFIEKKMDVIVIVAIDADALCDVLAKAKRENIKIIAYDRLIRNADVDLYISFDNEKVGSLMADYLLRTVGNNGTIIRINGSPTDNNVKMVSTGFENVLRGTNVKIDKEVYADGWLAETGFTATNEYLATGKVPMGIMCGNDGIAAQAIKALSESRLAGKVFVVGQDADLDACQRIVEGTQSMTVYKPVENLAQKAAEEAVSMAKGDALETEDLIFDGTYYVPYEKLEPIAVTKENMDEVIIGKFHQKEEVYLNVQD